MDREDLAPHVDEIMEAIGDDVSREHVLEELERYVNVFRLNIQTAKRTLFKKLGGPAEEYHAPSTKKIGEIQPGEMSINFIGKIVSINEKEIEVKGEKKNILYGLIGDETATVAFTVWDIPEEKFVKGDVISVRNAYSKEFGGRVQFNFGSRTGIKKDDSVDIAPQEIPMAPSKPIKIGEIDESCRTVEVTGRILSVDKKIIAGENGPREIRKGMIGDETGRIRFASWGDARLKDDDVIKISGANVRFWKGLPQLNFDNRADITAVSEKFPTSEELMVSEATDIAKVTEGPGAADVIIRGVVLQIREGSGLIFRCPECKRVLQKGSCRIHGKAEGVADLRIKAVLDDGTGALTAIISRDMTENLIDMSIDECIEKARELMDYDSIKDLVEETLIARPIEVRGNVTVDEYGPMMIAQEARALDLEVREKAEKLLIELEESE